MDSKASSDLYDASPCRCNHGIYVRTCGGCVSMTIFCSSAREIACGCDYQKRSLNACLRSFLLCNWSDRYLLLRTRLGDGSSSGSISTL